MTKRHDFAFTITEIIVVIAIVGILVGILVPSILGLKMKAKKTRELNNLSQVIDAWTMYGTDHQEKVLQGFITDEVQRREKLAWAFPNESIIPPAPDYDSDLLNIAGPWTWRLMNYLDNDWKSLMFYKQLDWEDSGDQVVAHAHEIGTQPAFGYNGFYIGGWWRIDPQSNQPKAIYSSVSLADHRNMNVVTTVSTQIKRPAEQLIFASTFFAPYGRYADLPDDTNGTYLAVPSLLANERVWGILPDGNLAATENTFCPIGRYNRMPVIGYADGHVANVELHTLIDQRIWIPKAQTVDNIPASEFTHSQ